VLPYFLELRLVLTEFYLSADFLRLKSANQASQCSKAKTHIFHRYASLAMQLVVEQ